MKFSKTLFFLALSLVTLAILSAPAFAKRAIILKAADVHHEGYPNVVAMQQLSKKLKAESNYRITLQMFPGGIMGDEKSMIKMTQSGIIDILRASLGNFASVVPELNVFNMPFVFRNEEHMRTVIDGEIGDEILAMITDSPAELVALGWMDGGTRNLYTKKPVRNIEDLKGLKIRMMGNPLFVETMNAMGGNAISMSFYKIFDALKTGMVDGAENNPPSYYTQNHYTFAPYYNLTGHLIIPEVFVMSKVKWNKLSADDQALIKKLARETQMTQRRLWDAKVSESIASVKAAGVQIVEVDKNIFYDATAPVRLKYGKDFADMIKRIEAVN